ncbi:hypothetical protein [Nocardia sp. NPDC051833]|uniref:hypothetical protein n=1 Tax=Nocardia sp. NPDC051833 TaxID=3155674 RepID=UPI00341B61F4
MTVDELLALTADELEQFYDSTRRTYEGGDEEYNTLPARLRELSIPDGGLLSMIQLAHHRTRELERLRAQVQQDYAAIHGKQQRDQARIAELEQHLREEGAIAGRLQDQLRAACADGAANRDRVTELEELIAANHEAYLNAIGVDRTIVPPGTIAKMRAENTGPSPSFREAIARARQRRENPDG